MKKVHLANNRRLAAIRGQATCCFARVQSANFSAPSRHASAFAPAVPPLPRQRDSRRDPR
jgi:hypothetical protein